MSDDWFCIEKTVCVCVLFFLNTESWLIIMTECPTAIEPPFGFITMNVSPCVVLDFTRADKGVAALVSLRHCSRTQL